jgi:flagellar protein FliO/FliZ
VAAKLQKSLIAMIMIYLFSLPLYGQDTIVHAESFNGNVKQCIDQPAKCKQNTVTVKNKSGNTVSNSSGTTAITAWDVIKMILALFFVVALLYFLLKFINQKSRSFQKNRLIQNFGGTPLGGNKSIQIIKAGERILILGVGDDIRLIKEIDDKEEIEGFVRQYNDNLEQNLEARDIITKLIGLLKQGSKTADSSSSEKSFKSVWKSQLDDITKERNKALRDLEKKENNSDE